MDKVISGQPAATTFGMPGTPLLVDSTFGALRASLKPDEYSNQGFQGGHYRVAALTGLTTGIAANGAIFATRWAPATNAYLLLKHLQISAVVTTAFTAAQAVDFFLVVARGFTAADTGGTAIAIAGSSNKLRAAMMATSQVADMRIATTAALGAGTRTIDTNAHSYAMISQANAVGNGGQADLYKLDKTNGHPLLLAPNEGFEIQYATAQGAVGVVKCGVTMEWAEVPGI